MHRLAWHNQQRNERELQDALVLALLDTGETIMLEDEAQGYVFIANLPDIWNLPDDEFILPTDASIFGEELCEELKEAKLKLIEPSMHHVLEVSVEGDRVFQFHFSNTGELAGKKIVKTIIREVTIDRRRELLLRSLLREVSHRSKNLMAIIQSLASQTARFSFTKDDFLRKFRGRLHALAQSQDLITDSDWHGAEVFELLSQQVKLYLPEYPNLVVMCGDKVMLNPNCALYLGLAFHELVVNTVSHNDNLAGHKPLRVDCKQFGNDVTVEWYEPLSDQGLDDDESVKEKSSFGSVVLEKVVPAALNATAEYLRTPTEIIYRIKFPLSSPK